MALYSRRAMLSGGAAAVSELGSVSVTALAEFAEPAVRALAELLAEPDAGGAGAMSAGGACAALVSALLHELGFLRGRYVDAARQIGALGTRSSGSDGEPPAALASALEGLSAAASAFESALGVDVAEVAAALTEAATLAVPICALHAPTPVSYTHLTLPTICSV